jgi:hypothetical protein
MAFLIDGTTVIDNSRNANNLTTVQITGNTPFWLNRANVASSYTIPDGYNAMSVGPITINSGVTVTIGTGEAWAIV